MLVVLSCENEQFSIEETSCDNGTFVGTVILYTQEEVNTFGAMCYTKIDGYLYIGKDWDLESDIVDLTPLSSLTQVYQGTNDFAGIRISAANLTNLRGLENIVSTPSLTITNCFELQNILGLIGLQEITDIINDETESYPGSLTIRNNPKLSSLQGLDNLVSVGFNGDENFYTLIDYNNSLEDLSGLNKLKFIKGQVQIRENGSLLNLDGLNSLESIDGSLTIGHNVSLTNIDALSNLIEVNGKISTLVRPRCNGCSPGYSGNRYLSNLCGLQNLFTNGVYQDVEILGNEYNPTVTDIINGDCSL